MLLERTIFQLDIGHVPRDQAIQMAHMGYLQWLGGLPGDADYMLEALYAHSVARPFADTSPAVSVFCELLLNSTSMPPKPLTLTLPSPARRGGHRARRLSL